MSNIVEFPKQKTVMSFGLRNFLSGKEYQVYEAIKKPKLEMAISLKEALEKRKLH